MDWMKLGWALLLGAMVLVMLPRVKQMIKHSPKGSTDDWRSAIVPLLMVAGFVVLLIMLV